MAMHQIPTRRTLSKTRPNSSKLDKPTKLYDVTEVRVSIRFSADLGKGKGWKTVELGAEATLVPGVTLEEAEPQLYHQLVPLLNGHFKKKPKKENQQ